MISGELLQNIMRRELVAPACLCMISNSTIILIRILRLIIAICISMVTGTATFNYCSGYIDYCRYYQYYCSYLLSFAYLLVLLLLLSSLLL